MDPPSIAHGGPGAAISEPSRRQRDGNQHEQEVKKLDMALEESTADSGRSLLLPPLLAAAALPSAPSPSASVAADHPKPLSTPLSTPFSKPPASPGSIHPSGSSSLASAHSPSSAAVPLPPPAAAAGTGGSSVGGSTGSPSGSSKTARESRGAAVDAGLVSAGLLPAESVHNNVHHDAHHDPRRGAIQDPPRHAGGPLVGDLSVSKGQPTPAITDSSVASPPLASGPTPSTDRIHSTHSFASATQMDIDEPTDPGSSSRGGPPEPNAASPAGQPATRAPGSSPASELHPPLGPAQPQGPATTSKAAGAPSPSPLSTLPLPSLAGASPPSGHGAAASGPAAVAGSGPGSAFPVPPAPGTGSERRTAASAPASNLHLPSGSSAYSSPHASSPSNPPPSSKVLNPGSSQPPQPSQPFSPPTKQTPFPPQSPYPKSQSSSSSAPVPMSSPLPPMSSVSASSLPLSHPSHSHPSTSPSPLGYPSRPSPTILPPLNPQPGPGPGHESGHSHLGNFGPPSQGHQLLPPPSSHALPPMSSSHLGGPLGPPLAALNGPGSASSLEQQQHASSLSSMGDEGGNVRSLNVGHALSYLDQVKFQFGDQPEVYNRFLDIMKDFKSQRSPLVGSLETPGVIDRVSTLFRGHSALITGFNTFLPPGYRIEATSNPHDPVRVTTPADVHHIQGISGSVSIVSTGVSVNAAGPGASASGSVLPAPGPGPGSSSGAGSVPAGPGMGVGIGPGGPPMAPGSAGSSGAGYYGQSRPGGSGYYPSPIPPHPDHATAAHIGSAALSSGYIGPAHPAGAPGQSPHLGSASARGGPGAAPGGSAMRPSGPAEPPNGDSRRPPVEFGHAINYVNKIKNRFASEPDIYRQFLEILQTYQKEQRPIQEVYAQVQVLFRHNPDLLDEFKQFLPDNSQSQGAGGGQGLPGGSGPESSGAGYPVELGRSSSLGPQSSALNKTPKKRTQPSSTQPATGAAPSAPDGLVGAAGGPAAVLPGGMVTAASSGGLGGGGTPRSKKQKITSIQAASPMAQSQQGFGQRGGAGPSQTPAASASAAASTTTTYEELEFFEKCKKAIASKRTYDEFLKVLNLFSNELIDARTLVERVEPFLGKNSELLDWFKKFMKCDDDDMIFNIPLTDREHRERIDQYEKPEYDHQKMRLSGHSYHYVPPSMIGATFSGRDALGKEVLNTYWVSHPVFHSENGFVSSKKTIFEENLYQNEEQRYEYDMNIEANLWTITLLSQINEKMQAMSPEERSKLKYREGLTSESDSSSKIYKRVIRKIYDKDRGEEIINAIHNNPSVAIPIVLKRLKQKDEEWRRAKRDWNKVWREVDLKNFHKSLDHQGMLFKAADRKNLTQRSLVQEIENIYHDRRSSTTKHPQKYHLDALYRDNAEGHNSSGEPIFAHVRRLLGCTISTLQTVPASDERKLKRFVRKFIQSIWFVNPGKDNDEVQRAEDVREDSVQRQDGESGDEYETASNGRRRGGGNGTGDNLRAAILRRTNAGSAPSTRASRKNNRGRSDGDESMEDRDDAPSEAGSARGSRTGDDGSGHGDGQVSDDSANFGDLSSDDDEDIAAGDADANGGEAVGRSDTGTSRRPGPVRRMNYVFWCNSTIFTFVRLIQFLYSRLSKMKELSKELAEHPPRGESPNPVAVALGLQAAQRDFKFDPSQRYEELIRISCEFMRNEIDANDFEEKARSMFATSAYITYTFDKLCQAIVKQAQSIIADPRSMSLIRLYNQERSAILWSKERDYSYKSLAEKQIDDHIYKFEYFTREKVLTTQLIFKDELNTDDLLTPEEKWSAYVDNFVQLTPTEGVLLRRQEPFLRRSLPPSIPDEPITNVETRSGLEMKIAQDTYKIFFVDNTEDYFHRRSPQLQTAKGREEFASHSRRNRIRRFKAWREWLEGESGWKRGDANLTEAIEENVRHFDNWMVHGSTGGSHGTEKIVVETVQSEEQAYRRFRLVKAEEASAEVGDEAMEDAA